jgi:hypothetical protein
LVGLTILLCKYTYVLLKEAKNTNNNLRELDIDFRVTHNIIEYLANNYRPYNEGAYHIDLEEIRGEETQKRNLEFKMAVLNKK